MAIEYAIAATLCNVFLCFFALILRHRYGRHVADLLEHLENPEWKSTILNGTRSVLLANVDSSFLSLKRGERFVERQFSPWEEHDIYRTVGELLSQIALSSTEAFADKVQLAHVEILVKAIYQLQVELKLSDSAVQAMLAPIMTELEGKSLMGKTISAVSLVRPNDRVDENTMWPINAGLRVAQPLGLVIHSETNQVISRAKVICC